MCVRWGLSVVEGLEVEGISGFVSRSDGEEEERRPRET